MALDELIEIASESISSEPPDLTWAFERGVSRALLAELSSLLERKNGFFAFESSLLVLPASSHGGVAGLGQWNDSSGWVGLYDRIGRPALFFAQDAFAGQFGITDIGVISLNPETGETTLYGVSLEDWAQAVLEHYDYEVGWSAARDWQLEHGLLRPGHRLLPKVPFVLGGGYEAENLVAVESFEAMRRLGSLYHQIRDVSDGKIVTVKGWSDLSH